MYFVFIKLIMMCGKYKKLRKIVWWILFVLLLEIKLGMRYFLLILYRVLCYSFRYKDFII